MPRWRRSELLVTLAFGLLPSLATGQSPQPVVQNSQDLKRLTIEELADLVVTTPARRSERLSVTPAAVSVIREEDIRRSGATTLAEALRLADAMHVARV